MLTIRSLVTQLDQSIRHEATAVTPYEHRQEIRNLIDLADQQKANDDLLAKLQTALHTLAMTHQALAAAVQGNNPESISQKIAELQAAGKDLSDYYKSLPTDLGSWAPSKDSEIDPSTGESA